MRTIILAASVAAICTLAVNSNAKDFDDPVVDGLRSQAPDVANWRKVADGFYEGRADDGGLVRVYFGESGAKLALSEIERSRDRALGELDIFSTEPDALMKGLSERKLRAEKLVNALNQRVEFTKFAIDEISRTKATQTIDATTSSVCGWTQSGTTVFKATGNPGNVPSAYATMDGWGSGGISGPPPPAPTDFRRQVYTEVRTSSTLYDNTLAYSYDYPDTITAFSSRTTLTGACDMLTWHEAVGKCFNNVYQYSSVYREQTCAGVVANTPPYVH